MISDSDIVTIHVQLFNEGSATAKRVKAKALGDNIYEIMRNQYHNPDDEEWQFLPGDIVRCEYVPEGWAEPLILAIEKVG